MKTMKVLFTTISILTLVLGLLLTSCGSSASSIDDTVAPSVSIANGGDIIDGDDANFTITVTDDSDFRAFTPEVSNGSITSGACLSSPCSVVVSGASIGMLTLTVAVGAVVDAAGNANTVEVRSRLGVLLPAAY